MKIIKQIDDTHFEVEMQEEDLRKDIMVFVAHDYLSISGPQPFCTGIDIKGTYQAGASNCLKKYNTIQIPIRAAQKVFSLIKDHKYMQADHLRKENGETNYLWNNCPIKFKDENGNWNVVIRCDDETVYTVIPLKLYNQLVRSNDIY